MHYKRLGRVKAKTTWSNNGKKKTIPELQDCLVETIKLTKQWHAPDEPPMTDPQRTEIPIVDTSSNTFNYLDGKANTKMTEFNKDTLKECQWREWIGYTSVLEKMQQLGKLKIYNSFVGTRIEYLSELDLVVEGNIN